MPPPPSPPPPTPLAFGQTPGISIFQEKLGKFHGVEIKITAKNTGVMQCFLRLGMNLGSLLLVATQIVGYLLQLTPDNLNHC